MRAKFIWKIWTRKKWEFRNPKHPLSISLNQWCSASSAYEQHTISTSSVHPQGKVVQRKKNVPFSLMINSHKCTRQAILIGLELFISYHIISDTFYLYRQKYSKSADLFIIEQYDVLSLSFCGSSQLPWHLPWLATVISPPDSQEAWTPKVSSHLRKWESMQCNGKLTMSRTHLLG